MDLEQTAAQFRVVARLVGDVLGGSLIGVYPHGSAVLGALRPTSDVDVLALARRPLEVSERTALLEGLLDVSGRRARLTPGRPVELTVVVQDRVRPWRFPAETEFQYGEWLRDDYERGLLPGPRVDPDLALLLAVARQGAEPLSGPPVRQVLDPVPLRDVRRAAVAGVPALLDDLEDDTRNVLLTLARIWTTLATGEIRSKDAAADWALRELPDGQAPALAAAREEYLEGRWDDWGAAAASARSCARRLVAAIDRLTTPEDRLPPAPR